MPAAEPTPDKRAPQLLTVIFWSGVGLAPLALLIMIVGGSAGAIEVALALGLVSIVLIGLSMALRRDGATAKGEVERLVYDEIDTLREDIREDISHAARATHKALADRIVYLSETVDVLRGQVDTMRDQVDRVTVPPVPSHTTGVSGVLRHTETVQVTTRQTMLVDPHDTHQDGTVYGNRPADYGGRQPGFGPAADEGFRGPEPGRRRDVPPPDGRVRASARPAPPQESRSGRAWVAMGRPEQAPSGRARVEPERFAPGGVPAGRGGPGQEDRSGRARVGVGRADQDRFDGPGAGTGRPGPADPPARPGGTHDLAARVADLAERRGGAGPADRTGRGDANRPGAVPFAPQQRRAPAIESGPRQEPWSDQVLRERLNRTDPDDREPAGRRRADPAQEEGAGRRRREEPPGIDTWRGGRTDEPWRGDRAEEPPRGRRAAEEPPRGLRAVEEPSSGDVWGARRSVDDHDGSGEWTGGVGRRRARDESDSGSRRAAEEVYGRDVPEGGRRRASDDTGGRRRAYDPEEDGSRVTGVRTSDRWASVRSDDRGARELRMGERTSAVHEDATGSELRIEDRWARVREEPALEAPRRSPARQDRDAWGAGEPAEAWGPAERVEPGWSETRWDDGAWAGDPDGGRRRGAAPALPAAPQADDDNYAWNRAAGTARGADPHRLVDFEDNDDRWR